VADIKAAFRFIDKDDDGSLSRSEFRQVSLMRSASASASAAAAQ
jgi:Ca2+-binding EF-hand superfamily protein